MFDPHVRSMVVVPYQVNPTTANQQFCDRGNQYRSAIFPANKGQQAAAEMSLAKYQESGVFGEQSGESASRPGRHPNYTPAASCAEGAEGGGDPSSFSLLLVHPHTSCATSHPFSFAR